MGFIYKITNKLNNHLYIGQTRINIEQRWRDHCRVSFNENSEEYNFPIHRAIRKYGKDNFIIELIEQCKEEQLNEREIYWIAFYDSYKSGYNSALGGLGHQKYDYDAIINFYLANDFSVIQTCKYFGIYDQVVYSALKSRGIDYKALNKNITKVKSKSANKNKILLVEKNIIFNNMKEIDNYFGKIAHPNVRRCLNGITEKAYGFHWQEIIEGDDIE